MTEREPQNITLDNSAPRWNVDRVINSNYHGVNRQVVLFSKQNIINGGICEKRIFTEDLSELQSQTAWLQKEFNLLQKLAHSGLTPHPYEVRQYGEPYTVVLLMERLFGVTLDEQEAHALLKTRVVQVHNSAYKALDIIHQYGLVIEDINTGTCIFDISSDTPSTKIVDFEHAKQIDQQVQDAEIDRDRFIMFSYMPHDPALLQALNIENISVTANDFKQSEQYTLAGMLIKVLFAKEIQQFDMTRLNAYEKQTIEERIQQYLKQLTQIVTSETSENWDEYEASFKEALSLDVMLPYLLLDQGTDPQLPESQRLKETLNPVIHERRK